MAKTSVQTDPLAELVNVLAGRTRDLIAGELPGMINTAVASAVRSHFAQLVNGSTGAPSARLAKMAKPKRKAKIVRVYPSHCLYPKCKKPQTGPRFSFLCVDHRDKASKAEKKKLVAAWKKAKKTAKRGKGK